MKYKVTNIVYNTDGLKVDLPTELIVECDNKEQIAEKISDKTGWLVESFGIEKPSEICIDLLMQVRELAKSAIMEILTERKVESINIQPYFQDCYVTNYAFFEIDKNGNGECLEVESVKVVNGKPIFTMFTNYGNYWGERTLEDFFTNELVYIISILEEIFEQVEDGEPLLKEDETFDDYEEE